jgi:hypothetical protein
VIDHVGDRGGADHAVVLRSGQCRDQRGVS